MKYITVFATLFLAISPLAAQAQQVQSITLEEAIEIALEKNVDVQISKSAIERAESEYERQRADFLPNLNATVSGQRRVGQQFDQAAIAFEDLTTNNLNASISTSVTIFNGFRNINELRSARSGRESAEERYQRTRETIIFEAAARFLDVMLSQELLEIERENLEASQKQLEQVEAQVEVGMRPIVDQYSQESVVANNELSVIQAQNALNLNKLRLSRLLQLDPLQEYDFITPGIREEDITVQDYNLREMISIAMANRRDYRASRLELEQARYAMRISEAGRLPEVSLSASLSSAYRDQQMSRDPNTGMPTDDVMPFSDQFFDTNINRGLSFNVSIPIYNRRQTRNQIQQRQIDFRNAELQLEDLQQEVFLELQQAYNDYTGLAKELEATEKALIAAERAYETEQERYNVGSATLIELTNANNEFIRASSNRIQVMYQFVFQEKVLDFYLGRITEDVAINALSD
ncbi:TolC family protein [Balneolales bacterium ANBcel1]|nr:TolC family protein [Balneolales bacterium ANBcel1]